MNALNYKKELPDQKGEKIRQFSQEKRKIQRRVVLLNYGEMISQKFSWQVLPQNQQSEEQQEPCRNGFDSM